MRPPPITWVNRIDSTQTALVARAQAGEPDQALATTSQTAGHGRRGRAWVCPPGSGLALSVLARLEDRPGWSWLPLVTGVAVHEALSGLGAAGLGLKWPNDVLVDQGSHPGKLAGLVAARVEASSRAASGGPADRHPALVVGIGVNLRVAGLPDGASALAAVAGVDDPVAVADAVVRRLTVWLERWQDGSASVATAYRDRCVSIGRAVRVELPGGEAVLGTAVRIDDDGRLVVGSPSHGELAVSAGDVVHLRPA
jgi:BirA family biotin operon repressor/biotin-[acetyl-CoA-carboxylase] ligase